MPNILTLNGSPVPNSSTGILLTQIADGIESISGEPVRNHVVRLNDYAIISCQSCGESPEPDWCFYQDDIYPVYELLIKCDIVLFGSPIYFDTVSAQSKLFIDRCNCLRPADFKGKSGQYFKRTLSKKRLGAIVLVGGERQKFECARTVIAGFFKWIEIVNVGNVIFAGSGWAPGAAANKPGELRRAFRLGRKIGLQLS